MPQPSSPRTVAPARSPRARRTRRPNGRRHRGCARRSPRRARRAAASLDSSGSSRSAGCGVLVRGHLQRQALVHRTIGEPVQLARGVSRIGMPRAVAIFSASRTRSSVSIRPGDVHRRDGHLGAQRLDDGVAPGDDLAARLALAGAGAPGLPATAALGWLVGLVVRAVGGLGGRALALEPAAALAAGPDGGPFLLPVRTAPRRWELPAMSRHPSARPGPNGPRSRVLDRDAGLRELLADRNPRSRNSLRNGLGPGPRCAPDQGVEADDGVGWPGIGPADQGRRAG